MNTETEQSLSRAYELIESDQLDEARSLLKAVLESDKNNADAWWLYAHAVSDPDTARLALTNVQRIDPDYPEAAELLETLQTRTEVDHDIEGESSFLPPIPATLPGLSSSELEDDDNWDAFDDGNKVPVWQRPVFLLAIGLTLFLIIAAIVITRPGNQLPSPNDPTTVAENQSLIDNPTTTPSLMVETPIDVQVQLTEDHIDTVSVSGEGSYTGLLEALSGFDVNEDAISSDVTLLGNTTLIEVCTSPGPELRTKLEQVMMIVTDEAESFQGDDDAVGVRMVDCDANIILLVIAATRSDLTNYANGNITEEEFQARWTPVG